MYFSCIIDRHSNVTVVQMVLHTAAHRKEYAGIEPVAHSDHPTVFWALGSKAQCQRKSRIVLDSAFFSNCLVADVSRTEAGIGLGTFSTPWFA